MYLFASLFYAVWKKRCNRKNRWNISPHRFFVICGFEHSVANMYYIPAGIFASHVPAYAAKAAEAGLDLSMLTWGNFLIKNLIPVTIGNILGGVFVGASMWLGHCTVRRNKLRQNLVRGRDAAGTASGRVAGVCI